MNETNVEDGFAGVKKNTRVKPLNITKEKSKMIRHKYKCEIGKKSYTFKNKKELANGLGLSRNITNKIIKGELASDKLKVSLI